MLAGLKNIVCVFTLDSYLHALTLYLQLSSAADHDFSTLYIPLLLLSENVPDAALAEPVYLKYVLKAQ